MLNVDILSKTYNIEDNKVYVVIQEHGKSSRYTVKHEELLKAISDNKVCILKNKYDKLVDLTGQSFGDWIVLEYVGNRYWKCKCSCGNVKSIHSRTLITKQSMSCGHSTTGFKDLTNKRFGELKAIRYIGDSIWECQCDCGNTHRVLSKLLMSGQTKSCGHNTTGFRDLTHLRFGDWNVLEYTRDGYWLCECSCGEVKEIQGQALRNGRSKSCGHNTSKLIDLTHKKFGEWTVLEYYSDRMWLCECSCGIKKLVSSYSLRKGLSKSCGHNSADQALETKLEKYNETYICDMDKNREEWQIRAVMSREALLEYISTLNGNVTVTLLSKLLNIGYSTLIQKIHKYKLDDFVDIHCGESEIEKEITEFIRNSTNLYVETHNRSILKRKELDIYIPEKKIAIEVNGTYWHSTLYKDKYYHQKKTLACESMGIHLIHIFEYEWKNESTRNKLQAYIKSLLRDTHKIYARDCIVQYIDAKEAKDFFNMYHLQGSDSTGNIAIALKHNDNIVSIMSFGTPRFNKKYDFELVRYCTKEGIRVIGGASKLFKEFRDNHNNPSVIAYCDITKFTGNVYERLGFERHNEITSPNYVWVNTTTNEILTRYNTQKHKLIKLGLGSDEDTEDNIMKRLNFIKIYNSGNKIYIYK